MLFKKPLLIELILTAILVAFLHYIALVYSLYWAVSWFDIPMHFLGGFVIGILALYVFYTSGYIKFPSDHQIIIFSVVIAAVLIVGLTWELWELFSGLSDVLEDQADTILDVVMDFLGAIAAYYYGRKKIWRAY